MHTKIIVKVIGLLLIIFSLTLAPPILIGLYFQDGGAASFLESFLILTAIGLAIWYPNRNEHHDLKVRDGFLIVVLFWTALGFAGAIPFLLDKTVSLSVSDALFESFSGLTTTGATVLTGLDELPHSFLWYRQQLQWLGGMGIIVLAVAVLPMLGIGGMQLYKAETPGPVKDAKLAPRISETAKTLWYIYVFLTISCALAYKMGGMSWFDAFCHSFSTVAIGGFSTHDSSIGYFDSIQIETIAIVFMFLSGINFALHFSAFRHISLKHYLHDPEFKAYGKVMLAGITITTLYLYSSATYPNFMEALRYGSFQVVSIATTTGFASTDFTLWPAFVPAMLIIMSFIGGCAGSTGGGMKVIRVLLLFKQGSREINQLLHPNAIMPVKLNRKPIPEKVMTAIWGFFSLYIITLGLLTLILMAMGLDQVTAFSAVAAMINNLGPGLGEVSANFAELTDPIKWILTFTMLLGRLELFTLLVLFTRAFWRS